MLNLSMALSPITLNIHPSGAKFPVLPQGPESQGMESRVTGCEWKGVRLGRLLSSPRQGQVFSSELHWLLHSNQVLGESRKLELPVMVQDLLSGL